MNACRKSKAGEVAMAGFASVNRWTRSHPATFLVVVFVACGLIFHALPGGTLADGLTQSIVLACVLLFLLFIVYPETILKKATWSKSAATSRAIVCLLLVGLVGGLFTARELIGAGSTFETVPADEVAVFVAVCLFTGVFEESLFRGVLFGMLGERFSGRRRGFLAAALISSAIFAFIHVSTGSQLTVGIDSSIAAQLALKAIQAFAFGMVMCLLNFRTASIWPVAIVHGVYDMLALWPAALSKGTLCTIGLIGTSGDILVAVLVAVLLAPIAIYAARAFKRVHLPRALRP